MNRNGRIIGGALVGLALLWLLRIAGALPFSDRTNNQVNAQIPPDRPPIANFDATRTNIATLNPGTGTEDFNTPGTGTGSDTVAQTPGGGTTSGTGTTGNTGSTTSSGGTTSGGGTTSNPGTTPAIPAAW